MSALMMSAADAGASPSPRKVGLKSSCDASLPGPSLPGGGAAALEARPRQQVVDGVAAGQARYPQALAAEVLREELEVAVWVQCETCDKWRRVPTQKSGFWPGGQRRTHAGRGGGRQSASLLVRVRGVCVK